jgi:hypothetical protein
MAYTVVAGDNARSIAKKHNISVEELKKDNPTTNWSKLQVGQRLVITQIVRDKVKQLWDKGYRNIPELATRSRLSEAEIKKIVGAPEKETTPSSEQKVEEVAVSAQKRSGSEILKEANVAAQKRSGSEILKEANVAAQPRIDNTQIRAELADILDAPKPKKQKETKVEEELDVTPVMSEPLPEIDVYALVGNPNEIISEGAKNYYKNWTDKWGNTPVEEIPQEELVKMSGFFFNAYKMCFLL